MYDGLLAVPPVTSVPDDSNAPLVSVAPESWARVPVKAGKLLSMAMNGGIGEPAHLYEVSVVYLPGVIDLAAGPMPRHLAPVPTIPAFQPQTLTATDPNPAYTAEFALSSGQDLAVSMAGAIGGNGSETITLQGWDGSGWVDLSVQGIFGESPSSTLYNTATSSKYRVQVRVRRGCRRNRPKRHGQPLIVSRTVKLKPHPRGPAHQSSIFLDALVVVATRLIALARSDAHLLASSSPPNWRLSC